LKQAERRDFDLRFVNPDGSGRLGWHGQAADEALGMRGEGDVEDLSTLCGALRDEPVVHVVGREEAEPSMMVLVVVPAEEILAVRATVFDAAESVGEIGPVLECLEVRLEVRVVIRDGASSASW